jgi:hypothetical protein
MPQLVLVLLQRQEYTLAARHPRRQECLSIACTRKAASKARSPFSGQVPALPMIGSQSILRNTIHTQDAPSL